MIIDIAEIERLNREKQEENKRFTNFLKGRDPGHVDKMIHELNHLITSAIDCTLCGNCCTKLRPVLSESDIDRLMKITEQSRIDFKKEYVETDMEGDMLLKHVPCKFYKDKKCMIYPSRPEICASYPNLHKTEVSERIVGIMNNYAICPIVFNVIEELKVRVGFKG